MLSDKHPILCAGEMELITIMPDDFTRHAFCRAVTFRVVVMAIKHEGGFL